MRVKSGIVLVDKPLGATSRQALFDVQKRINCGRLGHTGTLDPLATGLLVLLSGQARKLQNHLTLDNKVYTTVVTLGAVSETDDAEGPIHERENVVVPDEEKVRSCLQEYIGVIDQVPPQYSAIKIKGKRAYKSARAGENVEMPVRQVHIHSIKLVSYEYPHLSLEVKCGSGTYIRSLARDIGENLQTGGYVSSLRRIQVGSFSITDAKQVDDTCGDDILSLEQVLKDYPRIDLEQEHEFKIFNGQKVGLAHIKPQDYSYPTFIWIHDKVVAIAKIGEGHISTQKLIQVAES